MPVIDSRYGIYIKDSKPVKVCQWIDCPDAEIGYEDRKMKMCARCNVVRYCSKSCQRLDWSEHKLYCQISPIMDIAEWMERHESLFRWALIEGLRLRSKPSNIFQYVLLVEITRMDRLMKGVAPSPFFVESMRLKKFSDMEAFMTPDPCKDSRKIMEAGGIGQGIVVFQVSDRRPGGYTLFRFQYHDFHEKPSGEEGPSRTGWENVTMGVVNGEIPISLLSRRIEGPPDAASSK
ncbi:MYND-type domain-containing protein [Mycena venus]|uniref:MYND-type domain-containing protein n=1 Tax=Mycena venus TaxID=2733690 RepID=A0A8H6Y8B4_9AGAR|nr:MYND-type domain-containing protein [Mycena venus]